MCTNTDVRWPEVVVGHPGAGAGLAGGPSGGSSRTTGSIARSAARHAGTTRRPSAVRAGGGGSIERPRPTPTSRSSHLTAGRNSPAGRSAALPRLPDQPLPLPASLPLRPPDRRVADRPTDRPTGSLARYKLGNARPKSSAFITLPPQINHTVACAVASNRIRLHYRVRRMVCICLIKHRSRFCVIIASNNCGHGHTPISQIIHP